MNVPDLVYETARQFAEIAASQKWIEARVGDLNLAAKEVTAALEKQQEWFVQTLKEVGIVIESQRKRKRKKKPAKKQTARAARKKAAK